MGKKGVIFCKRGTHVGMMISFALFITFLAFLYSILEPSLKTEEEQKFLLDYLEVELIKEFSEELISMTVIIDGGEMVGNDCVLIQDISDDIIVTGGIIEKLIIKDEDWNILEYRSLTGNIIEIKNPDGLKFFKIYYSQWLTDVHSNTFGGGGCDSIDTSKYKLGLTKKEEYVSDGKIDIVKGTIQTDLDIYGAHFGFNFTRHDGTTIGTDDGEITKSVFVREVPVQYFNRNASILPGTLNIKVW